VRVSPTAQPQAEPDPARGRESRWRRIARRLREFAADERATSDVEYILITAMVVLPLFVVPPLLIRSHSRYYDRVAFWVDLPVP
jgi:hypothetical protein